MELKLSGKIAVITGGNRGLGAASAEALAAEGTQLFLTARDAGKLQQTADKISQKFGADVATLAADLTDAAGAEAVANAALEKFGRIDILVCSAGSSQGG